MPFFGRGPIINNYCISRFQDFVLLSSSQESAVIPACLSLQHVFGARPLTDQTNSNYSSRQGFMHAVWVICTVTVPLSSMFTSCALDAVDPVSRYRSLMDITFFIGDVECTIYVDRAYDAPIVGTSRKPRHPYPNAHLHRFLNRTRADHELDWWKNTPIISAVIYM